MAGAKLNAVVRYVRRMTAGEAFTDLSDGQLIQAFLSCANEDAFAQLLKRHGPMVLAVCRRVLHNEQDAEDVFQATFLALARQASKIRKQAALGSWLHGVARNMAANTRKAAARRRAHENRAAGTTQSPQNPAWDAAWREVQAILDVEIEQLPAIYREPFILCCLEHRTCAVVAKALRLKEGTVWSRVGRAKSRLQSRLAKRGISLTAVLAGAAGSGNAANAALAAGLIGSTALAAARLATSGGLVPGMVSPNVAALVRGMTKAVIMSQIKGAAIVLLGAVVVTAGLGVAAARRIPEAQPDFDQAAEKQGDKQLALPAMDADGQPLPAGAVARLGSRRFRLEGWNDFALPTPDGKFFLFHTNPAISGSNPHGLMLMDAETGLRVRLFEDSYRVAKRGSSETFRSAAFSPDGAKLYALAWHKSEEAGHTFYVWDSFDTPRRQVLLTWDVATGKLLNEWDLPAGAVHGANLVGLDVSPDGQRLHVYGAIQIGSLVDRRIRGMPGIHVFDAATGRWLATWLGAGCPVGSIAGGKELLTFQKNSIVLYNEQSGLPSRTFPVAGYVPCVILDPDRKIIAALDVVAGDGQKKCDVIFWDAATGREIRRLVADPKVAGHWSRIAFSNDSKVLFLGGDSGEILRWGVSNGQPLSSWRAHERSIATLFSRPATNELVSVGGYDGAVHRWDAATGKARSSSSAYIGQVAVTRTSDGKGVVAVDEMGKLDVWDLALGRVTKSLQTPGRKRHELLFTPDGKQLIVAAESGPNTVWDLASNKQVAEFSPPPRFDPKANESDWNSLAFDSSGHRLVASKKGSGTWLWTWPDRKLIWQESKEKESFFFPDGKTLISSEWNDPIEFRDPQTGSVKSIAPIPGMTHVTFAPDGRKMVTTHLGELMEKRLGVWRLRDGTTGKVLKEVQGLQHVMSAAFSPSGWLLAVATDKSVRVYDTPTWQEVARFDGHEGTVHSVFFGADDGTLVSASREDGTALVWSLKTAASPEPPDQPNFGPIWPATAPLFEGPFGRQQRIRKWPFDSFVRSGRCLFPLSTPNAFKS